MAAPEHAAPDDSNDAFLAFRAAIEQHRGDGTSVEDLRGPLREFCAHAHRERMSPEQVLIRVKHALDGLSAFDIAHPTRRQSIRNQIISLAIETYYADRKRDGG